MMDGQASSPKTTRVGLALSLAMLAWVGCSPASIESSSGTAGNGSGGMGGASGGGGVGGGDATPDGTKVPAPLPNCTCDDGAPEASWSKASETWSGGWGGPAVTFDFNRPPCS